MMVVRGIISAAFFGAVVGVILPWVIMTYMPGPSTEIGDWRWAGLALLVAGGVIGAQFGSRVGARLPGDSLRLMLGLLILGVGARLLMDLVVTPADIYSLGIGK